MSDENLELIKEKIQKLFALAGSSNENEASLAASKAQELLEKHNLSVAEIGDKEDVTKIETLIGSRPLEGWRRDLISTLAYTTFCTGYYNSGRFGHHFYLVGKKRNIVIVQEMYKYLEGVVFETSKKFKEYRQRHSFQKGMVYGIMHKLEMRMREQKKSTESNERALVVLKDHERKEAENWMSENIFKDCKAGKGKQSGPSDSLYAHLGYQAGLQVGIDQQIK
jgi:hypothetical protein